MSEVKTCKGQVYDELLKAKDGLTADELSKILPYSKRGIRECTLELKNDGLVKTEMCRCHHTPIYFGVKA